MDSNRTDYCSKCGNTGEIFATGESCYCKKGQVSDVFNTTPCLHVPEQYRGLQFDTNLVPADCSSYYPYYLEKLQQEIRTMKLRNQNIFIGAPAKHSKTIFAETLIQELFRKAVDTFPLVDVLELKRYLSDYDRGKKSTDYPEEYPPIGLIYTTPYLFLKLPADLGYETFITLKQILDRRLRRNGSVTIVLSDYPWSYIIKADKTGILEGLVGDGSFGTLQNKSFFKGGEKDAE